ncbi:hypothetical protein LWI29_028967 [Acer saccharum]|uniref:PGG domain-containing protein n=1 Tax=Acer saccharum TaxID=4024 RepID=A0AA39RTE5_ACESA|nr:hypothetical protein LWI29_028967 [Acer saccharum]
MKEYSRDQHYNKYQQRSGGCCRVYFCCSDCRFNVSSSEEADQSSNSDRFASISSLAHTMVQERLDQMIRRQRQQQDQARLHRDRSLRKQIRDHDHHQGTRFIVMVALEKCSHDPREDFKESMIEMIRANWIEEEPYQAVIMEGKWEALEEFFDNDEGFSISYPIMTVTKDNAFQIAVHSKSEQPLKQLLERVVNYDHIRTNVLNTANAYENTVLHEAAINHNIAAVKLLVRGGYVTPDQLLERNKSGQTPLFKAAAFGSTKVVKYLASQPNQIRNSKMLTALKMMGPPFSMLLSEGSTLVILSIFNLVFRSRTLCIPTGDDNYDEIDNTAEDENFLYDVKVADSYISDHDDDNDDDHKVRYNYLSMADGRWPTVRKIWKEKRKRKFAFKLAQELIKNDDSWQGSYTEDTTQYYRYYIDSSIEIEHPQLLSIEKPLVESDDHLQMLDIIEDGMPRIESKHQVETPLLAATRSGVIELVKEILKMHPQAVEHISHKKQNILHVASYRQREVFDFVKDIQMPASRLILGIDDESYTVLHHVADTRNCNGGTRPGPAYQLQQELEWFKHLENKSHKIAKELFKEKHAIQHKEAQQWIKETSQSCSGVAVLVATVVFAAAFTVPGGNNDENGLPILLNSPYFLFFTLMDVVSLSCSLTSVVMFLSIITSPFELDNYRILLPRRLTLGFALLFMSVATTMLAFTSTIFLIIRSEQRRRWTLTLICSAAFVPVSVLALTHFPLFVSFIRAWNNIFKLIWMAFPYNLLLQIFKFLGNYIRDLGLGFLELGLYIKELGIDFLKFLHKLVCRLGFHFLKFLHYLFRRDLHSKDEGNA